MDKLESEYRSKIESILARAKLSPGTPVYAAVPIRSEPALIKSIVSGFRFEKTSINEWRVLLLINKSDESTDTVSLGNIETVLKNPIDISDYYYKSVPKWGAKMLKNVREGTVVTGMTREQLAAVLGRPRSQ